MGWNRKTGVLHRTSRHVCSNQTEADEDVVFLPGQPTGTKQPKRGFWHAWTEPTVTPQRLNKGGKTGKQGRQKNVVKVPDKTNLSSRDCVEAQEGHLGYPASNTKAIFFALFSQYKVR